MLDMESSRLQWKKEWVELALALYKQLGTDYKTIAKILSEKFGVEFSYTSVLYRIRKERRGSSQVVEFKDASKIPEVIKPYIVISKGRMYVTKAKYVWLMSGKTLEENETHFIHWDDNMSNCEISNLQPTTINIANSYKAYKRNFPYGDIELNKDIFKRIFLETISRGEKL